MTIRINKWMISNQVNGPGRRFVIWLQGCHHRCSGCINPETWDCEGGADVSITDVMDKIKHAGSNLEGVTFSGGEPMNQAKALIPIAKLIKSRGMGVISYSGYTYRELTSGEVAHADELLKHVDMLIDGRYSQELKAALPWRGSTNQNTHFLTDRYLDYKKYALAEGTRRAEIRVAKGNLLMTGIFSETIWHNLREKLNGK